MSIKSVGAAAVMVAALVGCVSKQEVKSFPTVQDLISVPEGQLPEQNIRLRPGDSIDIRLGGVPLEEINQVTGTYSVDTQGFVNMPEIGRVKAAGLTQSEFQMAVEQKYREQNVYSQPTVTVNVPMTARFVNVGGEVRMPQRVPYTPDLTVLSAITAAGGFTEFAAQTRVRIYREGKFDVVNLKEIRRHPNRDIPLQPGDSIEVMRSFF